MVVFVSMYYSHRCKSLSVDGTSHVTRQFTKSPRSAKHGTLGENIVTMFMFRGCGGSRYHVQYSCGDGNAEHTQASLSFFIPSLFPSVKSPFPWAPPPPPPVFWEPPPPVFGTSPPPGFWDTPPPFPRSIYFFLCSMITLSMLQIQKHSLSYCFHMRIYFITSTPISHILQHFKRHILKSSYKLHLYSHSSSIQFLSSLVLAYLQPQLRHPQLTLFRRRLGYRNHSSSTYTLSL